VKIANCPFCGGEGNTGTVRYSPNSEIAQLNKQNVFHFVSCAHCGSSNQGLIGHHTPDEAIAHWNGARMRGTNMRVYLNQIQRLMTRNALLSEMLTNERALRIDAYQWYRKRLRNKFCNLIDIICDRRLG
jgi:hypothetical protein